MKKVLSAFLVLFSTITIAQETTSENKLKDLSLSGLKFRSVGPALTSGRVADIAVNPNDHSEYYVAAASGGVWKTSNHGTTFQPIFDGQGSYSIGCVTIDPSNSNIVWVGTGENNNQRSVAYGDGVYKSEDAGKSWKKMGFEKSEHIGMIAIHPNNSDLIYVAAYGPLWSSGGDRGIYRSNDRGETWDKILEVSENTGFNEIHFDPRNPDVIYVTAHQRRRHVWTYLSGGPESAIYKSEDGGENWKELKTGIPSGDKGRIALAIPPSNPDIVYAMIEGHGFYRSEDRGASFSKMSGENTSGNYYVEIVPHPHDANTIYSMDTYMGVTYDGGKNFKRLPEKNKHVDNHCLWINPEDPNQMIAGCDGGIYETYDNAGTWHFKPNLPITQFYKVAVDMDTPFYNIYGGTQDNFSLGGPSRTINNRGIVNSDWYVTNTGDGFESAIDPVDPDIVYAQAQYGYLVRFNRETGESVGIRPSPEKGGAAYRYNWDAPLLISPHNHKRIYFAANKVFRSDNMGNTWQVISDDLSQQIDRHTLPVMDKIWGVDAIAYDRSTSNYGNIVALDESPLKEDLLYVGTDDGLIQMSPDAGQNWVKYDNFPGIPKNTYVNALITSQFDTNTVFAVFNNHKNGDFKPYVLKSTDRGLSWRNISGDLPDRGSVYSLAQDHEMEDLLFVGTEFGVYFSIDGGLHWKKLGAGLPTIAVRDLAIQKRENDLVLGTFGRGFYVLDDYSPLRQLTDEALEKKAHVFDVKDGLLFLEAQPLGYSKVGFMGASYFQCDNPPTGATFTYYIKESVETLKSKRKKAEKEKNKNNENITYPSADRLRAEDREEKPYLIFAISDSNGQELKRFTKEASAGISRVSWDGRYGTISRVNTSGQPLTSSGSSYLALPGDYSLSIYESVDGQVSQLVKSVPFHLNWLNENTIDQSEREVLETFWTQLRSARRKIIAVNNYKNQLKEKIKKLKASTRNTAGADLGLLDSLRSMEYVIYDIEILLNGDNSLSKRNFDTPPSLMSRMSSAVWNSFYTTMEPTSEQRKNLEIVRDETKLLVKDLTNLNEKAERIRATLRKAGAPYLEDELPELE